MSGRRAPPPARMPEHVPMPVIARVYAAARDGKQVVRIRFGDFTGDDAWLDLEPATAFTLAVDLLFYYRQLST